MLVKSPLYKKLEELLLASQFERFFLKSEPQYNRLVLATLSNYATDNMERKILHIQANANLDLKASALLNR